MSDEPKTAAHAEPHKPDAPRDKPPLLRRAAAKLTIVNVIAYVILIASMLVSLFTHRSPV